MSDKRFDLERDPNELRSVCSEAADAPVEEDLTPELARLWTADRVPAEDPRP